MRLNPVGYSGDGNLYCTARGQGRTFRLFLVFGTEEAFVMSHTNRGTVENPDYDKLYNDLKEAVDKMDFVLKTPRDKFLKIKLKNSKELWHWYKQIKKEKNV